MNVLICVGSSCHLKGSHELVELFQNAIDENHLEGIVSLSGSFCTGKCNRVGVTVTEAGLNWCTVATVLDTEAQIGAKVFRTEQVAVAQGRLDLMSQGCLSLTYLEDPDNLISGDLIVTSGLGGDYPSGPVIGAVKELRTDVGGLTQYAVVTPSAAVMSLNQLFLITGFDVVE